MVMLLGFDISFTSLKYLFSLTSEGHVALRGSEGTQTGTWTRRDLHGAVGNRTCFMELQHRKLKFKTQHYHLLKRVRYSVSRNNKSTQTLHINELVLGTMDICIRTSPYWTLSEFIITGFYYTILTFKDKLST